MSFTGMVGANVSIINGERHYSYTVFGEDYDNTADEFEIKVPFDRFTVTLFESELIDPDAATQHEPRIGTESSFLLNSLGHVADSITPDLLVRNQNNLRVYSPGKKLVIRMEPDGHVNNSETRITLVEGHLQAVT